MMQMLEQIEGAPIAIVGGGRFCKIFLQFILAEAVGFRAPIVLGVADRNDQAVGVQFASAKGIFTTSDYRDLLRFENLKILIDLTDSLEMLEILENCLPPGVTLIDHIEFSSMWSMLRIREEKTRTLQTLADTSCEEQNVPAVFENCVDQVLKIVSEQGRFTRETQRRLVENRRAISQIIDGTTIPTFVINQDHTVTHWNKACERLTGYAARDIIGTQDQWKPFRSKKRPIMADLILDGVSREDVLRYYGANWQKSPLLKGAYEVEEYFPHLGEKGKWLFFTGAPIKSSDGRITGVIETLWDRTAEKQAAEEKDRQNRVLAETARELAKSEETLSQIIHNSTAPTFVIDKAHVITHWNKALEKLTGTSAADMVGTKNQWIRFREKARPSMADVVLDQLGEDEITRLYGDKWQRSTLIADAYEAEEFFPALGESGRWCFFRAAPIKAPDGSIAGAIETMWDRTADRLAEQERERHTRELAALCAIYRALSISDDLEVCLEQACLEICSYLNAAEIHIYTRTEEGRYMLRYGKSCYPETVERQKWADKDGMITRVGQSGQPVLFEDIVSKTIGKGDGRERKHPRSLAYIPVKTRGKKVFGVIRLSTLSAHRFTLEERNVLDLIGNRIGAAIENAMLQEQYKKSEEKYRDLFNNAPNPTFILDSRNFEILDTNRRMYESYGYRREELLGRSFLALGDDDEELAHGLRQVNAQKSFIFTKKKHYRKDGHPIYVNINISSLKYDDGDLTIVSTSDISESVEKEIQLVQAGKMTTLGTMAAGMAHEINQPLNVIQVCADYLSKMIERGAKIAEDELKTIASDITGNVQRAAGIINHMRDFARQSDIITTRININNPIRDVFKVLGYQLKVHQIELRLDLAQDLPTVLADHNRLEQVFINLVTNAIDAIDDREKLPDNPPDWERTLIIRSFRENESVVVTVSDSGTGMPREVIERIFEPFFTTKKISRGTGLGMSISYGIVKEYNGEIGVKSEIGRGTTFTLRFPI